MSRLPKRARHDLDDDGRAIWDLLVERHGERIIDSDGGLVGPFNAWVTAPHIGSWTTQFASVMRGSSIDRQLLEIAVLTTAARWKAEFEWFAHSQMALAAGVAEEVVAAIARGEVPSFQSEDERVVHELALQLARDGRVADATFGAARRLLGDAGVVELVALCGFYALVSFVLNAFEVPTPDGSGPVFPANDGGPP
jgi:4-carboxymuconolactone decarboxylase